MEHQRTFAGAIQIRQVKQIDQRLAHQRIGLAAEGRGDGGRNISQL